MNIVIRTNWLYVVVLFAVLLNFSGLFNDIMAPDGALYASIAKAMVLRHNYTDLFAEGRNWLDKPHFPFWMAALSFNCFGFTTWAYKLPAILFLLMGAVYTYFFAKKLYSEQIALWSAIILLTAQHIVLSNNDVRAEPYLTGLIIASVYHFYRAHTQNKFGHLVVACLFAACAVMTKGIFAMLPICGAIAGQLIITKQWKALFKMRWLLAAVLVLVFILPELYCLYRQFDMHPERVVFGRKNVSGVKFFFWDSQFGRFLNTGPIKGKGDPSFFVHTTLWAFLPWSLLLFAGIFQFVKKGVKNVQNTEWYCISGAMLTFLVFSVSKFQLPFYTNIIYPFFAIITAQYLCNLSAQKSVRVVKVVQIVLAALLISIIAVLHYFYQPENFSWLLAILFVLLLLAILILPQRLKLLQYQKIGLITVIAAIFVNLYLNLVFYPSLLKYQAGSQAAFFINKNNLKKLPVVQCASTGDYTYPLEFYLNQPLYTIAQSGAGILPDKPFLIYLRDDDMLNLQKQGWHIQPLQKFDRYWITKLTPAFLNKNTRQTKLEHFSVAVVN